MLLIEFLTVIEVLAVLGVVLAIVATTAHRRRRPVAVPGRQPGREPVPKSQPGGVSPPLWVWVVAGIVILVIVAFAIILLFG